MTTPKRILIADDNPAILDALKMMLEENDYQVEITLNGAATQDIQKPYPALILLDISMSGTNGSDICKLLKSREDTKQIPIIMISATNDIEKISRDCGADDFITKPFQMEHLLKTIAKYTSKIH